LNSLSYSALDIGPNDGLLLGADAVEAIVAIVVVFVVASTGSVVAAG